jgi:MinD superfamily P-loop ATPase
MKELVIISGKGGTGKTSLTAALCHLAKDVVCADCDVDAADLHLLLQPQIQQAQDFYSGNEAQVRPQDCRHCDLCAQYCVFVAVVRPSTDQPNYRIDPLACEGCGVCVHFCPAQAIDFPERLCGQWFQSNTAYGPLIHARLGIGAENSGKLVSLVRRQARALATERGSAYLLIDGPPGIGCPVIASISGADAVLIITEPTLSGRHDFLRVAELCHHFRLPALLCINKWDINPQQSQLLQQEAERLNVPLLGRLPYDPQLTQAQLQGRPVTCLEPSAASAAIGKLWRNLRLKLDTPNPQTGVPA